MKTHATLQWMLDEIRRGIDLEREDRSAALDVYRAVQAEADRLGVESAYLRWLVAMLLDEKGELEMAWKEFEKALAADPLALPVRRSFEVVAGRVRAALVAPGRDPADEATPRLYGLLVRAGEADLGAHLAMARWELATGRVAEARERTQAAVKLYPASREAWALLAQVARAQGDELAAAGADLEAASARVQEPLFGVLGQAKA